MKGFGVTFECLPSGAVPVALRGELDLTHAYTCDEGLPRVEEEGPPCIVVDLRELNFVDSAGCRASWRRARRAGRRLLLVRGGRAVQRVLSLTAVEETFEMVGDVPTALREPAAPSR
jgi:anti-anti-sigma factor